MTDIYRGKVSRQYPWVQRDGYWQEAGRPYPVVSLADAGPDFDHTGMPVLVVANPDQGDHADLLETIAVHIGWLRAPVPARDHAHRVDNDQSADYLERLVAALRATLAQRDEARQYAAECDTVIDRLQAVVEAVREWGPHTPRRVTRALARLSPPTAPDLPPGVTADDTGWTLRGGNPIPAGWEPDGWDPWWSGPVTGKAMASAKRIRPTAPDPTENHDD